MKNEIQGEIGVFTDYMSDTLKSSDYKNKNRDFSGIKKQNAM